ncbi:long-chain-fatty-acid--coa ligase 5, putative [Theileria annulata]|uniref:Long-chain-fatty-acid--coa ligase 5, putative n=1 Tax=Theileria annulata TaxID=5874 RepID=Q4UH68_THEAN|nr:long-chain-fatty-acid--coa ligase 5, putative [Theileria annulata]CAI73571.1 long-chain-fatty-acid--coa ligase 5, putative [Theileria annulata]|eukprot:XP_954248.1 long-chain-fatty-acid--coa ligase 5, putative [Theileria annulata]
MNHVYSVPLEGSEEEGYTPVYRRPDYKDKLLSCEDYFDGKIQTGWDVFNRGLSLSRDKPFLGKRVKNEDGTLGEFQFLTYGEGETQIKRFGSGLLKLNKFQEVFVKEENQTVRMVGIYSQNTVEWLITEQVCNAYNLTLVPLYDTLGEESLLYIVNVTKLNVIVCDYKCSLKLMELLPKSNGTVSLLVVTGVDELPPELVKGSESLKSVTFKTYTEMVNLGKENELEFTPCTKDSIGTISYTSGVSGIPKGVIIKHFQHVSLIVIVNRIVCDEKSKLENPKVHLSYLPLSHMFERLYIGTSIIDGSAIGLFSGDIKNVLEDIKALKPNVFPSVPRVYMRIHDKIFSTVSQKSFLIKSLFGLGLHRKLKKIKKTGVVTHRFWDKILFSKFNMLLGGRVNWMLTGSAPLTPKIFDNIRALFSIPLVSGYGLTETCAGAFHTERYEPDSTHVGGPVPCMEFRLKSLPDYNYYTTDKIPKGELLLRGHNIVSSYFNDEVTNKESFDENKWFLTGDIAELLPNGAIRIIDRRKNIFKLSQGEYISPEKIESILNTVPIICQSYVTGKSHFLKPVAVVVPDEFELELWSKKYGFSNLDRKEQCNLKELQEYMSKEIEKVFHNSDVKGFEKIKNFYIEHEMFTIENNLLTTTSKLKRYVLSQVGQIGLILLLEILRTNQPIKRLLIFYNECSIEEGMLRLNNRVVTKLCGQDSFNFLQGLISSDLRLVRAQETRPALFLSSQGHIVAESLIFTHEGDFYLDSLKVNHSKILNIINKRKLASKVYTKTTESEVYVNTSESDFYSHFQTEKTKENKDFIKLLDTRNQFFGHRYYCISNNIVDGVDFNTLGKDNFEKNQENLSVYDIMLLMNNYVMDVMMSKPGFVEYKLMPFDLNLQNFNYLSANKGCYVGQEIINRINNKVLINKYKLYIALSDDFKNMSKNTNKSIENEFLNQLPLLNSIRKVLNSDLQNSVNYNFFNSFKNLKIIPNDCLSFSPDVKELVNNKRLIPILFDNKFGFVLLNRNINLKFLTIDGQQYTIYNI